MLGHSKLESLGQVHFLIPNPRGRRTSCLQQPWAPHDSGTEKRNRLCALQLGFPYRTRKEGPSHAYPVPPAKFVM